MPSAQELIDLYDPSSDAFKYLNAMLNGPTMEDEWFAETRTVIETQICESDNLELLAERYKKLFIEPLLGNGGSSIKPGEGSDSRPSTPAAADPIVQGDPTGSRDVDSPASSSSSKKIYRKVSVRRKVLERDSNRGTSTSTTT